MTDEKKPSGLHLIPKTTPEEERWRKLSVREFGYGSWQEVLERAEDMLEHSFQVDGVTDQALALTKALEMIPIVLREEGMRLPVERLPLDFLLEQQARIARNLGLVEFMRETNAPDLPATNIAEAFELVCDELRYIGRLTTREGLGSMLYRRGIHIRHSDLTRILLDRVNRDRLVPLVLVIPNRHKSYNPYLTLLEGERPLPVEIQRLLRCFSR